MSEIYNKLRKIMESMGIIFWDDIEEDFAISDYIGDSITFIQFIIDIEEEFNIQLTDDFLSYELLESAKGFANKLDAFLNGRRE